MMDRTTWLTGLFFLFLVSFAVYGSIKETEKRKEKVEKYIIADVSRYGRKVFFGLAESWEECLRKRQKAQQSGVQFEYEVCDMEYMGVEERWEAKYRTQIGDGYVVYRYADENDMKKFFCIIKDDRVECREEG